MNDPCVECDGTGEVWKAEMVGGEYTRVTYAVPCPKCSQPPSPIGGDSGEVEKVAWLIRMIETCEDPGMRKALAEKLATSPQPKALAANQTTDSVERVAEWRLMADKLAGHLNWFCMRVDNGEIRSKRTYAEFKDALAEYGTLSALPQQKALNPVCLTENDLMGVMQEQRACYQDTYGIQQRHHYDKGILDAYRAITAAQSSAQGELVEALQKIAKMPDLPNPERDADWKNCMKWAAFYAQEALAKHGVTNG